jgi:pyrroline-5-carboxylate reductase
LTKTPNIAFIGAGNMGFAMLRGLIASGAMPAAKLHACDLNMERLQGQAATLGFKAEPDALSAVQSSQVIVLATKPQGFAELLPQLAPHIKSDQLVVSIAAGQTLGILQGYFPAVPVIRVMPNTPGLIGEGVSAYCMGTEADTEHALVVEALLKPLGRVLRVDEKNMDAVTALSGSGPAYIFLFMEALQAAGQALGLSEQDSFGLAAETIRGAAGMIIQKEFSPAVLREKVTSPGGTTAAAIKVFEEGGLRELTLKAMTAARDRSIELGK